MRILAVSHESLLYGAPRSLTLACLHLSRDHDVRLLTHGAGDLVGFTRSQGLGVEVLDACDRIPDPKRGAFAFRLEQAWLRIQRRLCRVKVFFRVLAAAGRADLVYVNTVLRAVPVWAARLAGKPVVIHVREAENYLKPASRSGKWRLRHLLGSARDVICVSEAVRQLVLAVPGTGLTPERVHTIHNGIEAASFAPDPDARAKFRAAHGIPDSAPVVCFVGNMRHRKGIDVFLRAADRIRQDFPQTHFLVAGGSAEDIETVRNSSVSGALAPVVHFLGFVDDVRPVLWASDIFAMLSRCEPFARVNLEASAAGCAAVATTVDGNVEIFEDRYNALTVAPDDLDATVDAMAELLRDDALRETLSRAAQDRVRDRFTLAACHNRIADVLAGEAQP